MSPPSSPSILAKKESELPRKPKKKGDDKNEQKRNMYQQYIRGIKKKGVTDEMLETKT